MEPTTLSRRLLWQATRSKRGLAETLFRLCRAYVQAYHDFSYNSDLNGERTLLNRLTSLRMKTVFDVGANIGDWTKLALQAIPGSTIHAFELSEATQAAFRRNITTPNVLLVDAPLGSDDGRVQFKDFGDSSGLNTIVAQTTHHDWRAPKLRECIAMRGDTYCRKNGVNKIDLMKVDVEGYESAVLEGFGEMLKPATIRCIQFEYGYGNGDLHWLMKDFNDYLSARGYIVGKLWHDGVSFAPFDYALNNFESGPNFVAVGRDDVEIRDLVERKQSKPPY